MNQVNDWAYQLENLDSEELAASAFDLLVIDYSADGGESGEWTAGEIESLRGSGGDQPKIVLAYLSIGEAEGRVELEGYLDLFKEAGGTVLTVDYCDEQANIAYAYERSGGRGYVPYCTKVKLDELRINPGHEPD